ncbi:heterokaryon incompatibility protein-domain-containing protein [Ilyonectria destructans]|nr:heterokaryon incompatibility protein-domain-containing protein [Ilyonectria destructans]
MTSVERDEYNVYSCASYVRAEKESKYSVLTYTWGRFRLRNLEGAPALRVRNTSWKMPTIKTEHFSVEQFQHIIKFLGRDDIDWAWIDIACIHQEDERVNADEVGRQVIIFKNAHRAFVWLSQTNHHNLAYIIHEVKYHSEQVKYCILDLPTSLPIQQGVESLQKCCIELFGDPWFSSLWTLQELVLRNDALALTREAEPVEWCFGDYPFLSELIG